MSGPVLQFNLDNFKYKVIHNGTHITGFNIRTGGLNSGDYGGHDYSVYAYFSDDFNYNLSVTELKNSAPFNMGTQTLSGTGDQGWASNSLDFSFPRGGNELYLYFSL